MSIYTLQYYHITAAEKTQARHPRPRRRLYCHTGGGTPETMEKALIRMLQALSRAALGTGFPFLMTTLGAAVVFFFAEAPRPQFQKTMLGFAAGVMTAASVWSLLLPAIDRAADVGLPGWLPAAVGLLCGVVFLAALDAVRRAGMNKRVEYISFSKNICEQLIANGPKGIKVAYLGGDLSPRELVERGYTGLHYHIGTMRAHEEWFDEARKLGLEINVWTVNDEGSMKYLIGKGVDYITTDEPELLQSLLGK